MEGRVSLHALIRELKNKGKTIVLASHDMTEVEQLCDRIAVLRDGVIAFDGTVEQLARAVGRTNNVRVTTTGGQYVRKTRAVANEIMTMLGECAARGEEVLAVNTDRGTLEEHFIALSGGVQ